MPFIVIQILVLGLLALFPELITWLPGVIYPG
jgi:TRAP-type mannitol/chloroaromatic compound transport system permease large subunit